MASKKMKDPPEVPTHRDLDFNVEIPSPFFAFYDPAGVPEEVKQTLIPAIKKAINEPKSKAKIEKMGFMVDYQPPEALGEIVPRQYKELKAIMDKVRAQQK